MGVKNTPEDKEAPYGRKKDGTPAKKRGRKDGWKKIIEETEPSTYQKAAAIVHAMSPVELQVQIQSNDWAA